MQLTVPELSLVLLIGASGSGKSTFAATHFRSTEVLSSDHYRGVVSDDATSQPATADAFDVLEFIARKRLARAKLTVIDATNVDPAHRKRWVRLAKEFHVLPVAIVLDVPAKICHERNRSREDRAFGAHVVRRQSSLLRRNAGGLQREGFRYVHRLRGADEIDAATIERPKAWTDRRDDGGPFDIIGDVHGCFDELEELLTLLGYRIEVEGVAPDHRFQVTPPEGRRALFLGDLVDRGPASDEVLRIVMDMVHDGVAVCVPGNHEAKLLRHLRGKQVKRSHGLQATIDQLDQHPPAFHDRVARFIDGLVSHFVMDEGRLVVAHAGMREDLAGRASGRVRSFALYGETTGETDEFGLPVRYPWARDYRGSASVVYGHTPVDAAEWINNTICIDTGCVFGGELTSLRWPERELVSVAAREVYMEPVRRPDVMAVRDPSDAQYLHVDELITGRAVATRFGRTVTIRPEQATAALEALSRFTVDPRWLITLPPTMSPTATSARPDLLEHPDEAFAYYAKQGVAGVVCEAKHMGSRALLVVGRDPEGVAARFGFRAEQVPHAGIVITRRGRRFFSDPDTERAVLERVRASIDAAEGWDRLGTDWVLLDAELMPWSAKAKELLATQYAPVGAAARATLGASAELLARATARGQDTGALLATVLERRAAAEQYVEAYRRYCWEVTSVDDLRVAPFHVLASEGAVHHDKPHAWHLDFIDALTGNDDPLLQATPRRTVALDDEAGIAAATAWWEQLTADGGEGMVVKPAAFLVQRGRTLVQPALKVRGREYLRIIYGPEYTRPAQLDRLRVRAVARKRSLAAREFALGLESLERFVERRALHDVHACVFAILALEAEAVDPRL